MPAARSPRQARERRARFTRPPRSSVGMTKRCQIGQVFPVYRQGPLGLRDGLLEVAGLRVGPAEVPMRGREIAVQFEGLPVLRCRGLIVSREVIP
jgi:hypothetical protein